MIYFSIYLKYQYISHNLGGCGKNYNVAEQKN